MSSLYPEYEKIADIVEKYSDLLLRVAFTYMKNISDAEDMVQEVFLKLVKNYPSFESDEHKKAWLIRVTINLCKNRFCKRYSCGNQRENFRACFTYKET